MTRWSADTLAFTTGHGRNWPSEIHGRSTMRPEADDRDLRREDDPEHGLDAALAEARDGDRRVGHLGAAQRAGTRTRDEVAEGVHQLVEA